MHFTATAFFVVSVNISFNLWHFKRKYQCLNAQLFHAINEDWSPTFKIKLKNSINTASDWSKY